MTREAHRPEAAGIDAALSAARPLGALQEARRLRSPVVGTEHLLMATMTDPVVRWAVTRAGRDLSEVQALVTAASDERRTRGDVTGPITDEAVTALVAVVAQVPELGPSGPDLGPAARSRAQSRMVAQLVAAPPDTAARRVLAELGMDAIGADLIAAIEGRAGRAPGRHLQWY